MIQDNRDFRHSLGEGCQFPQLVEIHRVLKDQAHAGQDPGSSTIAVGSQSAFDVAVGQFWALVIANGVTDAPEAVGAGGLHGFQHRADTLAQLQVGMADDSCRSLSRAGRSGIGDCLDVLNLAHRFHLVGAVRAVLTAHLDEHSRLYVVPAANVAG